MKEKGLKVWLQQVGRAEGWNCFCSPRSLADTGLPGTACPVSWLIPPPELSRAPCTRGTSEDQAEHGLCFALRTHQGRGSAAGPPRGRDRMTQDRGRSYSYCSWCCVRAKDAQREKPALRCLCCSRKSLPSDSSTAALGWGYPVILSPSWLTWTMTYQEKVGGFSEPYCTALTCLLGGVFCS